MEFAIAKVVVGCGGDEIVSFAFCWIYWKQEL